MNGFHERKTNLRRSVLGARAPIGTPHGKCQRKTPTRAARVLQRALEAAGVEFLDEEGKAVVDLARRANAASVRPRIPTTQRQSDSTDGPTSTWGRLL